MIRLLYRTEPAGGYYLGIEAVPPRGEGAGSRVEGGLQEGGMLTLLVAAGVDISRLKSS